MPRFQPTSFPSPVNARLVFRPAETAMTLVSPAGTFAPAPPQPTTVPLAFNTRLWFAPAEIATTFVTPGLEILFPHQLITLPPPYATCGNQSSAATHTDERPRTRCSETGRMVTIARLFFAFEFRLLGRCLGFDDR